MVLRARFIEKYDPWVYFSLQSLRYTVGTSTHSDTHTQYKVRCSTSVIAQWFSLLPLSPVSHVLHRSPHTGWLRRPLKPYPPHPTPHFSPPKSACSSGPGVVAPTVSPPEWRDREQYGRHGLRAWLDHAHGRRIAGFPPPPLGVRVRDRHMQKAGCGREQLP